MFNVFKNLNIIYNIILDNSINDYYQLSVNIVENLWPVVFFIPYIYISFNGETKNNKILWKPADYKGDTTELYSYSYSQMHNIVMSLSSILYFTNFIKHNTALMCIKYSCIYFFSDLIAINVIPAFKKKNFMHNIHHSVSLFNISFIIFNHSNNIELISLLFQAYLSEISIIFYNYRWFLYKINRHLTYTSKINNIFAVISYFIFRVLNLTNIFFKIDKLSEFNNYKYFFSIILILNYIWFVMIFNKLIYTPYLKKIE
tara:strand:- start:6436 stop:7209 length:774 start_codon:yes stop_codon:yes gene_type:complete